MDKEESELDVTIKLWCSKCGADLREIETYPILHQGEDKLWRLFTSGLVCDCEDEEGSSGKYWKVKINKEE